MNNKLLSIIAVFFGLFLPMKMQAQVVADAISAPVFSFDGDNIVMTCETQGANIYYVMSEFANEEEANSLAEYLDISEANSMRTLYTAPFPVTMNVVIKAVAKMPQQQGESNVTTIIYSYTAWSELLSAINYGTDVLSRAQNNANVSDDLKERLNWALEEGQMIYSRRGEMPDSHEAEHFTEEIRQIARKIEEIMGQPTGPEPYAVLSDSNTVLTFYYDNLKQQRNGMGVGPFEHIYSDNSVSINSGWYEHRERITNVVFDSSFTNCTSLSSTAYWFEDCRNLTSITGINNLKTENVTDMAAMFRDCTNLTNLDVSGFKTEKVTNMSYMFGNCSNLTSLDVSGFKTDNVIYLSGMFDNCSSLTSLNVSGFNTEKVTDMSVMFLNCSNLTSLNVSGFNTDNVTNMYYMFLNCSNLTSLDVNNFNTTKVTNMGNMFGGCSSLTSLDVSGFNTEKVSNMHGMFSYCSSLRTIYAGNEWSTAAVTDGESMFYSCTALVGGAGTKYDANHTDYTYAHIDGGTANPGYFTASGAEPWKDVEAVLLTGKINNYWYDVTGSNPNGEEAIIFTIPDNPEEGMEWEFNILNTFVRNQLAFTTEDGQAIDNIIGDILFETKSNMVAIQDGKMLIYESENERGEIAMVDPYSGMIRIMGNEITLRLLNDPNTKFMALPLCVKANQNGRDITVSNGSFTVLVQSPKQVQEPKPYAVLSDNNTKVTFYYDDQKAARGGIDINNSYFNDNSSSPYGSATTAVIDASFAEYRPTSTACWFMDCSSLNSITGMENLKTDNVTDMSFMFYGCSGLTSLDMSGLNTSNVIYMNELFRGCSNLNYLDLSTFNTEKVTSMTNMFFNCYSLENLNISSFNTSNVTSMSQMFANCSSLRSLDLSHFNTSNVVSMETMFFGCSNLESIDLSNFNTSKVRTLINMFIYCSSLRHLDLSSFNTENVEDMQVMFKECSSLVDLNISSFSTANTTAMGDIFFGCSSLASIQAGSANIPAEEYARIGNPNLLVYVNEPSLAPQGVQNVVINGRAQEIVLTDVTEGNNNWHCPEPFTAERIRYTRNFRQQTQVGISRGWESITLPFNVQTITHETQGQIIPFAAQGNGKRFWLRGYSENGLYSAPAIEANKPYVISMPNNTVVYPNEYNLNGRVTFAASNTTVPATPTAANMTITRGNISMTANFLLTAQNDLVYAINVGQARGNYAEGSVFARGLRDVRPFEAYTTHIDVNGARPNYIRIAAQPRDNSTGIETIENNTAEGTWYSLDGHKLSGEPKAKGIYILNGKKIVR